MKVTVAQLGARMHYAVPRILAMNGCLERLYTDFFVSESHGPGRYLPSWLPSQLVRRAGTRRDPGIPSNRVTTYPALGIEQAIRLRFSRSHESTMKTFVDIAVRFGNRVAATGLKGADAVYCFNGAGLEILQAARRLGRRSFLEQTIAPREVERQLIAGEREKFPGWENAVSPIGRYDEDFVAREREEHALADLIICGSQFVVNCLPEHLRSKSIVVPYGVDSRFQWSSRKRSGGPLRVLTVGAVGLRKGAPYTVAAAITLKGQAVFRMIGKVHLSEPMARDVASHVELLGEVPRSDICAHYQWADVLLLPSICEGSATVVYEALATGLPVICTPNVGSIVRDGMDGFVIETGSSEAIVEALLRIRNEGMVIDQDAASRASLQRYESDLIEAINPAGRVS
jgi:hypothetical protein